MTPLRRRRKIDGAAGAAVPAAAPPPEADGPVDDGGTHALDALAAILRAWGAYPIEMPDRNAKEIKEFCESWARHVLLATEPPTSSSAGTPGARDWVALDRSLRELRQQEQSHVLSTQLELRHVIWVCIQALGKASTADERSDGQVATRLQALREAAQGSDVSELRQEVSTAVSVIDGLLEQRRARHQQQVEGLSEELQKTTAALVRERQEGKLDGLTKVYCRAAMDDHLERVCQMARVVKPSAMLFVMDVDHFKWVNDKFGHSAGDDLLRRVAAALRQAFRRGGDFVARFGGDEFVGVIEEGSPEAAVSLGERILGAVREIESVHDGESVRIGMSIGCAPLKLGDTPRDWLDRADRALYQSKDAGRDRLTMAED